MVKKIDNKIWLLLLFIYLWWNIRVSTKNRLDSLYKKQQGHQTMTVTQVKHKYQIHINTVWCIYVIIMKKNIIIIKNYYYYDEWHYCTRINQNIKIGN